MSISLDKYGDNKLIEMISTNHSKGEAFQEIYRRYSNKIWLYCRKVFGDGNFAEDIFQDTFLKFLNAAEKGAHIENVQSYLLRIARNNSLNHKRKETVEFIELVEDIHTQFEDKYYETKELSKIIDSALELLIEEHKEAFILQVYEGLSYQEIADLTEVPLSTVRNRIVRAKSKLREILTPILG